MTYRPIVPVLVVIVLCAAGREAGAALLVLLPECATTCTSASVLGCNQSTAVAVVYKHARCAGSARSRTSCGMSSCADAPDSAELLRR
jgi:hypothetical protein